MLPRFLNPYGGATTVNILLNVITPTQQALTRTPGMDTLMPPRSSGRPNLEARLVLLLLLRLLLLLLPNCGRLAVELAVEAGVPVVRRALSRDAPRTVL